MPSKIQKRWLAAFAAMLLVGCATQSTKTSETGKPNDEIAVTGQTRTEPPVSADIAGPPPPPPSPNVYAPNQARAAIGGFTGNYAQMQPQPRPGDIDRDRYDHANPNPVRQVATDPVSTFSVDVDTASYSNVRSLLNAGRLPPRDAVRIEEMINYFQYDYPLPAARTQPFSTTVALTPDPWAQGKQLLHIGLQGFNVIPRERPPLNLVLLLDVSGSMSPENRLPLAIQGFRMLVDQLTARDHVSIVVYAGAAGQVLEPTAGNEKSRILAALEQLHAGGSTAGGEGLRLAYSLAERNFNRTAINRVMIATDGDFNVGINDPQQLQDFISHERETGIYLSVLAFGRDNYNDALMQRLAQNGNGTAAYIDTLAEARRVLHDEMASTLFPIANDVKIQIEFNPTRVVEYRLIGYETRMLNREDFNNDRVDAGDIGAGHAVTAIYELTPPGGPTLNDPLHFQQNAHPAQAGTAGQIAWLRIRYKLPGETQSRLIERPITAADAYQTIAAAPEATRWATAVAAYGQLLRGDPYLDRSYGWQNVIDLAQGARGRDAFGWRAEFVQLARAASTAAGLPKLSDNQPEPPAPHPPIPVPMPQR